MRVSIIDRNTIIKGLRIAIILSLIILSILILLTLDVEKLLELIQNTKPIYLLILILMILFNWIFAGLQIKLLVTTVGSRLSLLESISVYLSGAFVSNVTPFATGGGPFQVYFLHNKGVNIGQSSMIILIQFVLRLFFFGLITPIFFIFFNWTIIPGEIPLYLYYIAFCFALLFSILIMMFILVPGITDAIIKWIFKHEKINNYVKKSRKAKKILVKGRKELKEFRLSFVILSRNKGRLLLAGLYTIIYWSLIFLIIPIISLGLGLKPYFLRSYFIQGIYYLILPFMPTPGASGIAEIGFATLFMAYIPRALLGLFTFTWRIITFYSILLVGGIITLKEIGRDGII
jgi:glycosyltransferase 2 family protein